MNASKIVAVGYFLVAVITALSVLSATHMASIPYGIISCLGVIASAFIIYGTWKPFFVRKGRKEEKSHE
jgi:hypothetical protein